MIRRTAWALATNFNGSYIGLPFLALFTAIALIVPSRFPPHNLLMSFGFAAAILVGLLAGTTLAEIKVKPLSYVLPGQERSMAPAVVLVGAVLCLAYALLVLGRPMTIVSVPAWQQSMAGFGFGLGLFMVMVAVCIVTHDTTFTSQAAYLPLVLVTGALGNESLAAAWISLSSAIAESAFVAVLFAACGVAAVFHLLGDRTRSRGLCGAPFLPLKAYDNPFKLDTYRRRMKSGAFRPSLMTDSRASPSSVVMAAMSRRVVGTSWDYLVLDTRASGTSWEFAVKLAYLVLLVLTIVVLHRYGPLDRSPDALFELCFLVAVVLGFFPPTFRARLSPMPPVSRRRHFKSFLAKGVSVYALTIIATLLFTLLMRAASETGLVSGSATWTAAASLPLRAVLVVAAAVPIMCWAFATLRSTLGYVLFLAAFLIATRVVTGAAQEFLLAQSYAVLLLATAVLWLPFIHIAWKRCIRDDLLLL